MKYILLLCLFSAFQLQSTVAAPQLFSRITNAVKTVSNTVSTVISGTSNNINSVVAAAGNTITSAAGTVGTTAGNIINAGLNVVGSPTTVLSSASNVISTTAGTVVNAGLNIIGTAATTFNTVLNAAATSILNVANSISSVITGFPSSLSISINIGGNNFAFQSIFNNALLSSLSASSQALLSAGLNATSEAANSLQTILSQTANLSAALILNASNTFLNTTNVLFDTINSTILTNASTGDLSIVLKQSGNILSFSGNISISISGLNLNISSVIGPIITTAINSIKLMNTILYALQTEVNQTYAIAFNATSLIYQNLTSLLNTYVNNSRYNNCSMMYNPQIELFANNTGISLVACENTENNLLQKSLNSTNDLLVSAQAAQSSNSYPTSLFTQMAVVSAQVSIDEGPIDVRFKACLALASTQAGLSAAILSSSIIQCFASS